MQVLAEIALQHLLLLVAGADDEIDPDYQCAHVAEVPATLQRLTQPERDALARIAGIRVQQCAEVGITEGPEIEFCEIIADQSIYSSDTG